MIDTAKSSEEAEDRDHPRYPHLENLDRVPVILQEAAEVFISEKLHGTNARFGKTMAGEIWVGSRNNVITGGHYGFYDWAISRARRLEPGETVFGEWVGQGIQKGIDYGKDKRFFMFAVMLDGEFIHPGLLSGFAEALECATVPQIYIGTVPSVGVLDEMRTALSLLAEQKREGIVIFPWPVMRDEYGHRIVAKYKNPDFEERAKQPRPDRPPLELENVQAFVEQYATDNRLDHVMDQMREDYHFTEELDDPNFDPLDKQWTGILLKTFYNDVVREGRADYDLLSETDQKMVGKVLNQTVKKLADVRRSETLAAVERPLPLPL